jgi:hypothetical protein
MLLSEAKPLECASLLAPSMMLDPMEWDYGEKGGSKLPHSKAPSVWG